MLELSARVKCGEGGGQGDGGGGVVGDGGVGGVGGQEKNHQNQ